MCPRRCVRDDLNAHVSPGRSFCVSPSLVPARAPTPTKESNLAAHGPRSAQPGTMCQPTKLRAMFASRACRRAVMIGTDMDKTRMSQVHSPKFLESIDRSNLSKHNLYSGSWCITWQRWSSPGIVRTGAPLCATSPTWGSSRCTQRQRTAEKRRLSSQLSS